MIRLFSTYAAISLVPLAVLAAALAATYQSDAKARGRAEGAAEAELVAHVAVEPFLTGGSLSDGLTGGEQTALENLMLRATIDQSLLRLRIRDLNGIVVFSGDGSGLTGEIDDEAIEAAAGEEIVALTHLNSDSNDTGPLGPAVVEVYRQLSAGSPAHPVGVLEIYLPYAPIEQDVTAALHHLYRDLVIGLVLLWLVLLGVCPSVTKGP